jgi:glycosyltransferase involved in cell wall biosynthesis
MRIAYVYDAVYPWVTGGVQRRVAELGRRLGDDHDVHWFGTHLWDGPAVVERDGVTLHGVAPPTPLYVDGRRSVRQALSFTRHLVKPLLGESFDVVDFQQFPYLPVAPCKVATVRHGTPLVVTWHEVWGDYWDEYLGVAGVAGKLAERGVGALADAHVAVSPLTERRVAALTGDPVEVVPNGIDVDGIRRVSPAADHLDVLYVGRLIPEKNVPLLVRAVARLADDQPDVRCRIVGEGPDEKRVRRLVSTLGLRDAVELSGFLPDADDVYALMKAADTVALPSRREGFGITALEAQACGTPVVTVREPMNAAADLVDDGVTGVVSESTPSAFAAALERARGLSGRACVTAAAAYDWDVVAERTLARYEQTLEGEPVVARRVA